MSTTNSTQDAFQSGISAGIGVVGVLSLLGSASIIFLITYAGLYKKLHTRLVLYLSISDFIQSVAAVTSLAWISQAPTESPSCAFQAVIFQIGDVASAFASFTIATFVFITVDSFGLQKRFGVPGTKFEVISVCFIFLVPFLFAFIGGMREVATGVTFYGPVGFLAWCWVSIEFPVERMMLHYTWILLGSLYLILIYAYLSYTFAKSIKTAPSATSKQRRKLVVKMIGFPVIFLAVFVPLGIERLVTVISSSPGATQVYFPKEYVAFAIIMFVSNGFWNALYYGYTRKVYKAVSLSQHSTSSTDAQKNNP